MAKRGTVKIRGMAGLQYTGPTATELMEVERCPACRSLNDFLGSMLMKPTSWQQQAIHRAHSGGKKPMIQFSSWRSASSGVVSWELTALGSFSPAEFQSILTERATDSNTSVQPSEMKSGDKPSTSLPATTLKTSTSAWQTVLEPLSKEKLIQLLLRFLDSGSLLGS